jgi:phage protein D
MSKSLFTKVWVNGENIADDTVYYLRDESDVKKGDLVEIRMKNINNLVNSKHMVAGAKLEFQYGFIGDVQSSVRVARLSNIDRDYAENGLLLNIKAVDKGIELKKGTSQRIWNDVTLSEIAETIANEYGLNARAEPTAKKYHSIPQGGRSEWEFLNYLVEREHGNYHLQISDYTLILEKNKRSAQSKRTFIYGENIVSLRVQLKEVTQKPTGLSNGSHTAGIDPNTGLVSNSVLSANGFSMYSIKDGTSIQESFKRGLKEWTTKDGNYSVDEITRTQYKGGKLKVLDKKQFQSTYKVEAIYDTNGNRVGYRNIYTPSENHEAETLANHESEKAKTKVLTATLIVELDPSLRSGDMITLQTEAEADCGNWFIETVKHTVDKVGLTEMTLNKNGTAKPVKSSVEKNEKVNNTEGSTSTRATTRIYYGNNGNETGAGSVDNEATLGNNILNR